MRTLPDRRRDTDPDALECVRQFVEAENRRDLVHVRALLHDECGWRVNGHLVSVGAADTATVLAHDWAAAPSPTLDIEDLGSIGEWVTVRYRLSDAAQPGTGRPVAGLLGYTVFEVQDSRIIRMWQYVNVHDPAAQSLRSSSHAVEHRLGADASIEPGPPPPVPHRPARRRLVRRLPAIAAVTVALVLDELFFSTPVVATTARLGAVRTTALLSPIYFVVGLLGCWIVLRIYDRNTGTSSGVLERWATRLANSRHGRAAHRLLRGARIPGFLISAAVLGGPPTVWALRSFGLRRSVWALAVLSSAIFAVTFVGIYAGVASLVL